MSTIDIPLHVVTHILQQAEQRAATHETDESIGTAGRIREEFECVTERGEIMVIIATAIMN